MKLATLCYLQRSGQTLMLLRNKKNKDVHKGKWNGLGGKLMQGETPEECAVREIKEESGYNAKRIRLKGMIVFPKFDGKEDWYVFVFTCSNFTGKSIDSPEGTLGWIDNDKLLQLKLWEGDYIFLPWLQQKEFFSAKFVYEKKKLIHHQVVFYK